MSDQQPIIIIGAGMAGMAAARTLADANLPVLVLDKGRGMSGRMATRRWDDATFDHGAQFFSAKTPAFQSFVKKWRAADAIKKWWPNIPNIRHPRWIGQPSMNAVPKLLKEGINVLTNKRAVKIKETETGWEVITETQDAYQTGALLITMPAPQAVQLLANNNLKWPQNPLPNIHYHPCLVVLAKLNQPTGIPAPGGLKLEGETVDWMADNYQKGISKTPSLTIHANHDFSRTHLDGDLQAAGRLMLKAVEEQIAPAKVVDWRVHRWRYSLCFQRHPEPFWQAEAKYPLIFGGDGFGIGNVEGAYLSGLAMAKQIL